MLDYLRRGGFSYTLEPALLDLDSVDDLLFRTREGFCGHYASAFVDADARRRGAGAGRDRLSGRRTWNRFGDYLLDHASPTPMPGPKSGSTARGWMRVDPTAVVAPGRLTEELDGLLPGLSRRRARDC